MKKTIMILSMLSILFAQQEIAIAPYPWMKVGYVGAAKVFNTSCDRLPYEDPFYYAQGDTTGFIKVMEYVPDQPDGELYSILFSIGESGDSHYLFYAESDLQEPAFIIHCDHLDFLGEGVIIARGSMNEMFSRSRKFLLNNRKIKEVRQPYYSVDLNSIATKDFTIYRTRRLKNPVDNVRKGDAVNVLISDFNKNYSYYLIRSALGLAGWIKVKKGTWVDETPVKDLYYHGD